MNTCTVDGTTIIVADTGTCRRRLATCRSSTRYKQYNLPMAACIWCKRGFSSLPLYKYCFVACITVSEFCRLRTLKSNGFIFCPSIAMGSVCMCLIAKWTDYLAEYCGTFCSLCAASRLLQQY